MISDRSRISFFNIAFYNCIFSIKEFKFDVLCLLTAKLRDVVVFRPSISSCYLDIYNSYRLINANCAEFDAGFAMMILYPSTFAFSLADRAFRRLIENSYLAIENCSASISALATSSRCCFFLSSVFFN